MYQYPDGTIEIHAAGKSLPYSVYDKLGDIDQGEIVDNKRLGNALQLAKLVQAKRDNRRSEPSTAHRADGKIVQRLKSPGSKTQRQLNEDDLRQALEQRS